MSYEHRQEACLAHLDHLIDQVDGPQRRTRLISDHKFGLVKLVIQLKPFPLHQLKFSTTCHMPNLHNALDLVVFRINE
jgi:hypothetical protein